MVVIERKIACIIPYRMVFFPTTEDVRAIIDTLTIGWMARLFFFSTLDSSAARKVLRQEAGATICLDLNEDRDALFRSMQASTRNKIGKAERLGSRVAIKLNHPAAVDEFLDLYAGLAAVKADKVVPVNRAVLDRYSGCSDILVAHFDGKPICGHVNLRDEHGGRVRLLFSASRRFEDREMARIAGILNCYLHWHEILTYKEQGFSVYDLGGIAHGENPSAEGIDRFKAGFGGRVVTERTCLCAGVPLFGHALLRIFDTGKNR